MFDTYQVGPRSLDARVSVTEQRAPTDESVRLLREMEDKAAKQVLEAMRLESNTFKGVVQKQYDAMTDDNIYRCAFELNGKRLMVDAPRQRHEELEQFLPRFRDEVARKIANEILATAFQKLGKFA